MANDIDYTPHILINYLIKELQLKSDRQLAIRLGVAAPVISKIRHQQIPVGSTVLLRLHEESQISTKNLRALMGDFRPNFSSKGLIKKTTR